MKTGDAESEIWLEGRQGRSYLVFIQSKRRGRMGSKRWQSPVYRWRVESWEPTKTEPEGDYVRSQGGTAPTYNEAERKGRRLADLLELEHGRKAKR